MEIRSLTLYEDQGWPLDESLRPPGTLSHWRDSTCEVGIAAVRGMLRDEDIPTPNILRA